MAHIIHHFNGGVITHLELGERLTIGRAPGHHLQIEDATVSGDHAVIEAIGDGTFRIRDLGSTNGVLVRGKRVQQYVLAEGDFVTIGTHDLQFLSAPPEPLQQTAKIKKSWIPGVFYTSR